MGMAVAKQIDDMQLQKQSGINVAEDGEVIQLKEGAGKKRCC